MKKLLLRIKKNGLRMGANNSITAPKFIACLPYTFIPLFLLFLLPTLLHAQPSFIKDSLDTYVNREIKKWNIPGVAVAIVKDGKIVVCKGYGVRDASAPLVPKNKVDENTLFQIASNTKAFTGTSLALLAYQKRLSLDDKVSQWMPDFKLYDPLASDEVMVRDLLCHRLGFETFQSDMLNWGCDLKRKEIISNLRNVKPVYSFRSHYGYCNAAFLTAGELIPLVTDTSWDDFLKYHFFKPLNMTRTSTQWEKINSDANACKPYTLQFGQLAEMPYVNVDNLGPAASINSCVNDLSHWLLMQLDSGWYNNKQILPFEVLQMTRAPQTITGNPSNKLFPSKHFQTYGLGWFMEDYNGKKIISHDGGANGFVTTVCFIPEMDLGIVVLTNTDANYFYGALRQQIIDAYMNLPYRNYSDLYCRGEKYNEKKQDEEIKEWMAIASNSKPDLKPEAFAGEYSNPVYGDMKLTVENGKLYMYLSHHHNLRGELQYMGNNTFVCTYSDPEYGVKKFPFKAENGKVISITVSVNDFIDFMPYEFVKK